MEKKILLIEDNVEVAENISTILRLAKYRVIQAGNGKEGVELAKKDRPDLIICDIIMPELDGYGVIHILSHDETTAGIPFIFLSGKAGKEDFRTGMNLGADDYITKPFEGYDLLRIVDIRLRKSANQRQEHSPELGRNTAEHWNGDQFSPHDLSKNRRIKVVRKKELIFMEGQMPGNLYHIQSGRVKCFKTNSYGKELITGICGEGEFIGYLPLLKDMEYIENAEALEEVRLLVIPKLDFLSLLESNREISQKFIQLLTNDLVELEERLMELAYQPVRQRVAMSLLKLGGHFGQSQVPGIIQITRKDISSFIATAPETLNRILSDFKEEGLIENGHQGLTITNSKGLERVAKN
jgi:CRP-like cAMP-binding protein/AmiR/NasT family two-component response regulator